MTPCILASGALGTHGYGLVTIHGHRLLAHRVAYAKAHKLDVLTMGGVVQHSCDTRACINPDHLVLGTHASNSADMVAKGRQAQGEATIKNITKLTVEQVLWIKRMYVKGDPQFGVRPLARFFGVAHPQISRIVNGLSRLEITGGLTDPSRPLG